MARADFLRAEYSCRNPVAQPFQSRDEGVKLSVRVPEDVLAEDTMRPALGDDADNLVDEEPIVGGPEPLSGNAVRLARVAANDAIHDATPRSSVEGSKVRPDRRRSKASFDHARNQSRSCRCFPLQVSDANCAPDRKLDAKAQSAGSGTEAEHVVGT